MDISKLWNSNILSFCVCHSCYQYVLQHVPLLVVEMLIYCKKYFLIKHNKTSKSIYKSTLSNSPIGFDLVYFQKTSI